MNTQRVLVGTLYCGEGDFDRNRESVRGQTWPCEQVVISNLPEVEAHRRLYQIFTNSTYAYLLKLDADMVLKSAQAIETLVGLMECTKKKHIVHLVDDFFSNAMIEGIHFYRRGVMWDWSRFTQGCLRPDCLDDVARSWFRSESRKYRKSIAWHCHYASEKQAFHFGYHRWVKGRTVKSSKICCSRVFQHYLADPDNTLLRLACVGILAASSNGSENNHSYGPHFDQLFEHWKHTPVSQPEMHALLAR
jgi:hypothetical protein